MLRPSQPLLGVAHKQEEPLDFSEDSILLVQTVFYWSRQWTKEKQIRQSHMVPGICQPCGSPSVIQVDHEETMLSCRWSFGCARIWGLKWLQHD